MRENGLRRFVNIFLVAATVGSWLVMCFFAEGMLAQTGLRSLKYFTVLSNLFVGFVAVAWLISSGKDSRAGELIERLKYIAAASVGLTFMTVVGFLGPIYGYPSMFKGANLFLHLVAPLTAMAEVIFMSDTVYTRSDNRMVIVPPLLYGLGYLANILINGIGEWPARNDWYFFFAWGYPVGFLIYAILMLVTWLLGLMIRKLQLKRIQKR